MKITLVTTYALNLDSAPASRVLNIARELLKAGSSVAVIGIHSGNAVETEGVRTVLLKNRNNMGKIKLMIYHHYLPIKVFWHSLSLRSDVFIVRGHILAAFLFPILKLQKKHMIYDFHGFLYLEEQNDINHPYRQWLAVYTKLLEYISLRLADRILVVSEGVKESVPKKYIDKTIMLQNGVDIKEYIDDRNNPEKCNMYEKYHIKRGKINIGFIGNAKPWFNIEDMTGLSGYLSEDYEIIIVGSGYKDGPGDKNGKLRFIGEVPHEEAIFILQNIFDVCIVPYREIGYRSNIKGFYSARKVKEYMAAGKPIIVADIDGKESFLKDRENCLTYKPGDSRDLADKIQQLMSDTELYKRMCENNRLLAQKFSWGNILKESGLIEYLRRGG